MANVKEFSEFLGAVADLYKFELSETSLDFYWEDLKHFELRELREAFADFRKSKDGKFMPKTIDFLNFLPKKPKIHRCKWSDMNAEKCNVEAIVGNFCAEHYEKIRPKTWIDEKMEQESPKNNGQFANRSLSNKRSHISQYLPKGLH